MDELLSYRYATKEYVQARIAEAMNVAGGGAPAVLGQKTITANGIYNAASDSLDGYDQVTVNVPGIDLSNAYAACVREGTNGSTLHCYGQRILPATYSYEGSITKIIIEPTVTYPDCSPCRMSGLTTVEGCAGIEDLHAQVFMECPNLESAISFPKCTTMSGSSGMQFRNDTKLTSVTIGSVGYGLATMEASNMFYGCTQVGLTITFYTTGANVDGFLTKFRNNATNATIVVKASEATTYNGTSYAAGSTILTSTP